MARNKRPKRRGSSKRGGGANKRFWNDSKDVNNNNFTGSSHRVIDIEEDLRQQRLRQQERQKHKETEEQEKQNREAEQQQVGQDEDTAFAAAGDDGNNNSNNTYYRMIHRGGIYSYSDVTNIPSLSLAYTQQATVTTSQSNYAISSHFDSSTTLAPTSPTTTTSLGNQRGLLRHVWYGRFILEQFSINPRAYELYFNPRQYKWNTTKKLYQLPHGMYSPWDLTCKYHVPPFTRTLDVAIPSQNNKMVLLPTIVSTVQGGILLCQQAQQQQQEEPLQHRYHQPRPLHQQQRQRSSSPANVSNSISLFM